MGLGVDAVLSPKSVRHSLPEWHYSGLDRHKGGDLGKGLQPLIYRQSEQC